MAVIAVTLSELAVLEGGVYVTVYPAGPAEYHVIAFEVSSITLALAAKLDHEPPVAPAAPIPVIEYTAPAPGVSVLAESVGGALATVTVLVLSAVLLALVETAKLKLLVGAFASNTT